MSDAKWNSFPHLTSGELADDDQLPVSDTSQGVGDKDATTTIAALRAAIGGGSDPSRVPKLAVVRAYSSSASLDEEDDLAAYVRVTAAATITLPDGFPAGWQCVLVNATSSDTVELDAETSLTLPGGFEPEIQNRRAVTVVHVGSDVWEAHGALVEAS